MRCGCGVWVEGEQVDEMVEGLRGDVTSGKLSAACVLYAAACRALPAFYCDLLRFALV